MDSPSWTELPSPLCLTMDCALMTDMQALLRTPDDNLSAVGLDDSFFSAFDSMPHKEMFQEEGHVVLTYVRRDDWHEGFMLDAEGVWEAMFGTDASQADPTAMSLRLPPGMELSAIEPMLLDHVAFSMTSESASSSSTSLLSSDSVATQHASSEKKGAQKRGFVHRKRKAHMDVQTDQDMLQETANAELSKATAWNSQMRSNTVEQLENFRINHPTGMVKEDFLETFKEVTGACEFWKYVQTIAEEKSMTFGRAMTRRSVIFWK